jgi:hypothetical protein
MGIVELNDNLTEVLSLVNIFRNAAVLTVYVTQIKLAFGTIQMIQLGELAVKLKCIIE